MTDEPKFNIIDHLIDQLVVERSLRMKAEIAQKQPTEVQFIIKMYPPPAPGEGFKVVWEAFVCGPDKLVEVVRKVEAREALDEAIVNLAARTLAWKEKNR